MAAMNMGSDGAEAATENTDGEGTNVDETNSSPQKDDPDL